MWREIRTTLQEREREGVRSLLLFLHGYNVSFEEAALRAAQLGYDLNFPGITAFYSWPSQGSVLFAHGNSMAYGADAAAMEASEKYLHEYLQQLLKELDSEVRIHIIAHSMGNRGLLRVMNKMQGMMKKSNRPLFDQIFLAAPDVDSDFFCQHAAVYPECSQRTTLYLSGNDKPLKISRWLHGNRPRAGWRPPITIVPGVDTVDASRVGQTFLGHSYFAEATEQLNDIKTLILKDAPPNSKQRPWLKPVQRASGDYFWELHP